MTGTIIAIIVGAAILGGAALFVAIADIGPASLEIPEIAHGRHFQIFLRGSRPHLDIIGAC